ncbi:MAG: galactose ABC transporter substrate-binding protein [Niameybacter sp.]|uniref:galactose ABC transporter substrate-binding protein n=1 Tax=Niameybacter sp. TaxID=2033640 RepID=UPI002FCB8CB4
MKVKKMLSALVASCMMLAFVGCSPASGPASIATDQPAEPAKKEEPAQAETPKETETSGALPKIGVTIYKYDDNFMTFTRNAIQAAAEGKAELTMNDSQNDQAKQNDQVDTLIAKGVDGLIINLVDPGAAPTIAEKAKAAGIPVVFINKEYPDGTNSIGYDQTWYVGTNSAESGIIQGELILDAWKANPTWDKNGDQTIQYVMLMGEPGHPDAEARTKESIATINAAGIQTEDLGTQTGMWDATKGKELMETWLAAKGDNIEMVICNNDGMALGAVEALNAAGYFQGDKYMPVVGVDAIPEALELIKQGKMLGTVLNDPLNQGKAAVELAINATAGKDVLEGTSWQLDDTLAVRVPYVAITNDNLGVAEEAYGLK